MPLSVHARICLKSQLWAIKAGLQAKKCASTCTWLCLGWVFTLVSEEEMKTIQHTMPPFFSLKLSYKLTHRCCNMNLFPLFLPQGLCLGQSLSWFYFPLSFGFMLLLSLSLSLRHHSFSVPTSEHVLSPTQANCQNW